MPGLLLQGRLRSSAAARPPLPHQKRGQPRPRRRSCRFPPPERPPEAAPPCRGPRGQSEARPPFAKDPGRSALGQSPIVDLKPKISYRINRRGVQRGVPQVRAPDRWTPAEGTIPQSRRAPKSGDRSPIELLETQHSSYARFKAQRPPALLLPGRRRRRRPRPARTAHCRAQEPMTAATWRPGDRGGLGGQRLRAAHAWRRALAATACALLVACPLVESMAASGGEAPASAVEVLAGSMQAGRLPQRGQSYLNLPCML
jgi:hypothetical protein